MRPPFCVRARPGGCSMRPGRARRSDRGCAHKWSNLRELDARSGEFLARLWTAGAGPAGLAGPLTIDLDSSIVPVFGRLQAGCRVRVHQGPWLPPPVGDLREHRDGAVQPAAGRLGGRSRGAKSPVTETASRVRYAGATRQLTVRADRCLLQACRARHRGQARGGVLGDRPAGQEDPGCDRGHPLRTP